LLFDEFFYRSGSKELDPGLRLIQAALEKFFPGIFDKNKQIRATFCVNLDFLGLLEFFKWYGTQLKRRDVDPSPRVPIRTSALALVL
jgi:hypothetical protein